MGINREISLGDKTVKDDSNVWVAFGSTYVNTSAVLQFVNSLRYNDYQLWEGQFTKKEFVNYLKAWDREDVANERKLAEAAKRTTRD
jgi:hypothetical protein